VQLAVNQLYKLVLPGAARIDEGRPHLVVSQPRHNRRRFELTIVVERMNSGAPLSAITFINTRYTSVARLERAT